MKIRRRGSDKRISWSMSSAWNHINFFVRHADKYERAYDWYSSSHIAPCAIAAGFVSYPEKEPDSRTQRSKDIALGRPRDYVMSTWIRTQSFKSDLNLHARSVPVSKTAYTTPTAVDGQSPPRTVGCCVQPLEVALEAMASARTDLLESLTHLLSSSLYRHRSGEKGLRRRNWILLTLSSDVHVLRIDFLLPPFWNGVLVLWKRREKKEKWRVWMYEKEEKKK